MFKAAAALLPWDQMPDAFVADRASYMGNPIDTAAIVKNRPAAESAMRSHIVRSPLSESNSTPLTSPQAVIEAQLSKRSSPTNFILNTPKPTYLDLTLSFTLAWVASFKTAPALFTAFPLATAWLAQIKAACASAKATHPTGGVPPKISGEEAARLIHGAAPDARECVPDAGEPLLREGWLAIGAMVNVTPDDNGKEIGRAHV